MKLFFRKNTLATKLILYILLFSSFLTLILTSVQLFADYKTELKETNAQFILIQNGFVNGLSSAVWFFDEKQVRNHLEGILKTADVAELKLEINNSIRSLKREEYKANGPVTSFLLKYTHEGVERKLGYLHIYLSLDKVYSKLQRKFIIVLLSNAIKTFLVSYFIFVIFYRLVSEPLEKIAAGAKQISEDQLLLLSPEEIEEIKLKSQALSFHGNELEEVTNAITQMQLNFSYSFDSLRKNEARLKDITRFTSDLIFELDEKFFFTYVEKKENLELEFYDQIAIGANLFYLDMEKDDLAKLNNEKNKLLKKQEVKSLIIEFESKSKKQFISLSIRPFFENDTSAFVGYRGVFVNVTTGKEYEQKVEEQREHIKQMQKVDAIGELTAGIAHDFNNVLSVITASLKNITRLEIENENFKKYLSKAQNASEKGIKLSKRLLSFSRRQTSEEKEIIINDSIESIMEILSVALTASTKLIKDYDPNLWQTKVDISMLENVLINLCVNARDAISKSPDPTVTIRTRNIVHKKCDMIMLEVSDNGEGIPDHIKEKIFEPFFTTKEKDRGTGLGLSMVFSFVKEYNGDIVLDSAIGVGTSFKIYLPRLV